MQMISRVRAALSQHSRWFNSGVVLVVLCTLCDVVLAAAGSDSGADVGLGGMAHRITQAMPNITKLVMAISYVAGIGFAVAGIIKFKQHKDNPAQVPLGGPIAMIFIAAALIYLPTVIESTGETLKEGAQMGSPEGVNIWKDQKSGGATD